MNVPDYTRYRENSRRDWGSSDQATADTDYHIQMGAVLRIADSLEIIAKDRAHLEQRVKWAEDERDSWKREAESLARRNAALRGVITKLKRERAKGE